MKPILFNTEMVRAILEGRKTVTRRVIKPRYKEGEIGFQIITNAHTGEYIRAEYIDELECETRWMREPYHPGDILYVRETWGDYREYSEDGEGPYFLYRADYIDGATTYQYPDGPVCDLPKWHPSIHMPKDAARLFLRVTGVRAERLQEIDGKGAEAEGAIEIKNPLIREDKGTFDTYGRRMFAALWEGTVGETEHDRYGWAANPWVWVIEFKRIRKEEVGA